MKKFIGWLITIFCSILLAILAITLVITLPDLATGQKSISELSSSIASFIILISLLIYGVINGIKKIRKVKKIEIIKFDKLLNIDLNGQINYKDYRNLIFGLNFKKPVYLILLGVMLLLTLSLLTSQSSISKQLETNYFIYIIFGAVILTPILTLIQIKKIFKSNKIFHEQIVYHINNESIHIKGQTVDSTQKWAHFCQIKETANFFMLYQGKMVATLLDKQMFKDDEITEFKNFIKSLSIPR